MQMIIIETIKLLIALVMLAFIAKLRKTKPVCDPFFADQKWTLAESYRILLPLLIGVFLLFILSQSVPKQSLNTRMALQITTNLLWCVAIYIPFWLIIKSRYEVTASTFGLQKTEFLQAAVLPTNIFAILFLGSIFAAKSPSQLHASLNPDIEFRLCFLYLVTVVFVAPPIEELLWRGILYPPVIKRMPKWPTIVCLSFAESLSHVTATVEIFGHFLSFLTLYFLYVRSKSLYSPIILHIGFNLIASRPAITALLAVHIDSKILDHYFIWSVLFFAFCINLSWFMQRRRNTSQTLCSPLGAPLRDDRTHNDVSKGS